MKDSYRYIEGFKRHCKFENRIANDDHRKHFDFSPIKAYFCKRFETRIYQTLLGNVLSYQKED